MEMDGLGILSNTIVQEEDDFSLLARKKSVIIKIECSTLITFLHYMILDLKDLTPVLRTKLPATCNSAPAYLLCKYRR